MGAITTSGVVAGGLWATISSFFCGSKDNDRQNVDDEKRKKEEHQNQSQNKPSQNDDTNKKNNKDDEDGFPAWAIGLIIGVVVIIIIAIVYFTMFSGESLDEQDLEAGL